MLEQDDTENFGSISNNDVETKSMGSMVRYITCDTSVMLRLINGRFKLRSIQVIDIICMLSYIFACHITLGKSNNVYNKYNKYNI